jgi:hypothetical protein
MLAAGAYRKEFVLDCVSGYRRIPIWAERILPLQTPYCLEDVYWETQSV